VVYDAPTGRRRFAGHRHADIYLVKPFMIEELQAAVQALLRRGGAAPSLPSAS
jgi:DNA-binding response OmpR family regulator